MEIKINFDRNFTGLDILPNGLSKVFVYRRNFNWPHGCVFRVYYIIIWGRGDWGF